MVHAPVLLQESIDGLRIRPDGLYVDGTLGRGGHTLGIAQRLGAGRLIAIDCDAEAIIEARSALSEHVGRITFVHGNFGDLSGILDANNVDAADGMLFDLGVSSPQLDDGARGFSYMQDAPLDMRMDAREGLTAYTAVNHWPEDRLRSVFAEYGEERYARSIARSIVRKRNEAPIETTYDLNRVIFSAIPAAARREAQHPSKRCFMALRIVINDELGSIEKMLGAAPGRLNKGGRLCILSYHSLEDRIVKSAFNGLTGKCECPRDFPKCVCGAAPVLRIITKKPITPCRAELERNPRARSAKLRIAEKL